MRVVSYILGFLLLLAAGIGGWRAVSGRGHIAAPPGCAEVARLFGQAICAQEVASNTPSFNPQLPVSPAGKAADNLRNLIWQRALLHQFGPVALTPTAVEVEQVRRLFANRLQENYTADREIAALIDALLARNVYLPKYQERLRSIQKIVRLSVQLYDARVQQAAALPAPYHFVTDAAEVNLARQMVSVWRADKALYEAYGGRIVAANGDFEPVDAYTKFIHYIRRDGDLYVRNKRLGDPLRPVAQFVASQAQAPENPVITAHYFSDPTWRFTFLDAGKRADILRAQLLALPTLGPHAGAVVTPQDMIGKSSLPASP